MATKTKKKNVKRARFAAGKKVKKIPSLLQPSTPEPLVLDRVAKTFALLEQQRERTKSPLLGSSLEHPDARGSIFNIAHQPVGSVAVITSKANTVRANHFHKEDAHLCWVLSGSIEYYERAAGSNVTPRKYVIHSGEVFYTGPRVEHGMFFPEKTTFITLGRLSRKPDEYEADLVRLKVPLVEPKVETAQSAAPTVEVPVINIPTPEPKTDPALPSGAA